MQSILIYVSFSALHLQNPNKFHVTSHVTSRRWTAVTRSFQTTGSEIDTNIYVKGTFLTISIKITAVFERWKISIIYSNSKYPNLWYFILMTLLCWIFTQIFPCIMSSISNPVMMSYRHYRLSIPKLFRYM